MGLAGASALSLIAIAITPNGRVKKAVKLICGFAVILSVISGFTDFDFSFYSRSMADYRTEAERMIADSREELSLKEREYIETECEAYILDKAKELGLKCDNVSVTLNWSEEGYWYPVSVQLDASGESGLEFQLSRSIEAELGISPENQIWSGTDENG